jgi:LysM repeat protein
MRQLLLYLSLIAAIAAQAQSPQAVAKYVERYKAVAIEEMKAYGIPASVTLAQGIHESGCGCSALSVNSNNHFGIKCHAEWSGQTYHHDDDQPQECFRVYATPEESFRDHSEFLKNRQRYAFLFDLNPTDYKAWAKGLKSAGYATNPRYTEIIIKLIEDYNLNQYDKPDGKDYVVKYAVKDNAEVQMIKQSMMQTATPKPTLVPATPAPDYSKINFDERTINGVKAILYKKDIPLDAIAQRYKLSVQQIYAYNDLAPKDKIKENDILYVDAKKLECPYYQYEMADGESLRDVSQKFAIQLSELARRNELPNGCEPVSGEIIVLRGKREVPVKFRVTGKTYPSYPVAPTKTSVETITPADSKTHTVSTCETLYSISKQYKIPVDTLMKINNLKDEDIKIGQTLIVDL